MHKNNNRNLATTQSKLRNATGSESVIFLSPFRDDGSTRLRQGSQTSFLEQVLFAHYVTGLTKRTLTSLKAFLEIRRVERRVISHLLNPYLGR